VTPLKSPRYCTGSSGFPSGTCMSNAHNSAAVAA
jgi:hypothetical protein